MGFLRSVSIAVITSALGVDGNLGKVSLSSYPEAVCNDGCFYSAKIAELLVFPSRLFSSNFEIIHISASTWRTF